MRVAFAPEGGPQTDPDGLPMTTAFHNETIPFAVKFTGPKGVAGFILSHQPKVI